METRANHVLIGAFTLAVFVCAVLFALWAAKYTTEKSFQEYDVVFQEAVTGLSVGSQVLYSGISVGAVRRLSLMKDDPRKVVARIRLSADTPVKTDTRAKLALTGLTGVAIIQLTGGSPGSPALEPREGQRVALIPSEPSALQNIAATASEIVDRVNQLLSDENVARVTRTLDQLDQITGSISGEREEIAASSATPAPPAKNSTRPWPAPTAPSTTSTRAWSRSCRPWSPSSTARSPSSSRPASRPTPSSATTAKPSPTSARTAWPRSGRPCASCAA